jgi:hypothetical protein
LISGQEGRNHSERIQRKELGVLLKNLHFPGDQREPETIEGKSDPAGEGGALAQK